MLPPWLRAGSHLSPLPLPHTHTTLVVPDWTEKYQQAMSQGENQPLHDQLARWDQVRKAGITLSENITSLTADYEPQHSVQ